MEKGLKAWLAGQDFASGPVRVDIPGGWHWVADSETTGCLMTPEGQKCVGYDMSENTIQFGADGVTKAPGLNLWTVQEMGEKFARENFMSDETGREYDAFAKERRGMRSESEKNIRAAMSGVIQMELKEGKWTAHVDTETVASMTGIESEAVLSGEEGIALFNRMSAALKVMPLRDPMGYMVRDNNLYDYIKEQYDFQYNDTIENIDNGYINGNGRGCEAILDKLDATVRKNIREYCLPDGVNYQDLRHVEATPELQDAVDTFVKHRVTQTVNFEHKRSHSKESLEKDKEKFLAAGEDLKGKIGEAALPPMDVDLGQSDGIRME